MRNRALASSLLIAASLVAGLHCDSSTSVTSASSTGPGGAGGSGSGSGGSGGSGGGIVAQPCPPDLPPASPSAKTYYMAIEDPAADNDACDGLAPTDEGGGHCPWKDLSSPKTSSVLNNAASVRLVLRKGKYLVYGWEGLRVAGIGASAEESVVLSAFPGEDVVLDTSSPDGALCPVDDMIMNKPECVREVLRVSGQYTVVQGLTIQNGLAYNVEVTGGAHHVLRCNHLTETADFPMRSDSLKIDGGATDVLIQDGEFSQWRSQAIDMTNVSDVIVEGCDFHDPFDQDGGATGAKFGVRNVTIRNNTVRDLGSDPQTHAFSLGGTGTPHPDEYTAHNVKVIGNHVTNVTGILAQLVSCFECSVENNEVNHVSAGILLSASATGAPECSASPTGCKPSVGAKIVGNRFRDLDGAGDPAQANIAAQAETGEASGLFAGENIYCAPSAADVRFLWGSNAVTFDEWKQLSGTDATSTAAASSEKVCADP